jgi:hypothetical protein
MKPIHANVHQETEIYTYLSRRSLMKLIGFSAFGMGLWISACDHSNADSASTAEIKKIQTEILPFGKFYLAEDYHQKYQLRQRRQLMAEFKAMYSRNIDFVNSTAAARVNGYVGGHGKPETITANLESLGLSTAGQSGCWRFPTIGKISLKNHDRTRLN